MIEVKLLKIIKQIYWMMEHLKDHKNGINAKRIHLRKILILGKEICQRVDLNS